MKAHGDRLPAVGERADQVDAPQGPRAVEGFRHESAHDGSELCGVGRGVHAHVMLHLDLGGLDPGGALAVVDHDLTPRGKAAKRATTLARTASRSRGAPGSSTSSFKRVPAHDLGLERQDARIGRRQRLSHAVTVALVGPRGRSEREWSQGALSP